MSNAAITAAFERSQSKGVTRLVLLSIADRADDGGRAWCGANDIASRANIERRNVPRAIRELCDSGELFVEHRKGPNCSNVYHLSSVLMAKLPQNEAVSGRVVGVLKVSTKCSQGEAQTQGNPIEPNGGEGKGKADASHSISEVPSKWNEFTNLPSVKNLSDDRKRHLAARMAEPFF
jgi:Helix-turn-helix domain